MVMFQWLPVTSSPLSLASPELSMFVTISFISSFGSALITVFQHEGANIQLLDLPGIIEGASQGKGMYALYNTIEHCK